MSERRVETRARFIISVEVAVPETWAPDCTAEQILAQAERAGRAILNRIINESGGPKHPLRIVGDPKVALVLAQLEAQP